MLSEDRITHLNNVLQALRNVNHIIITERNRDNLVKAVCATLVETRGYYNSWIALFDKSWSLVSIWESGLGEAFLPTVEYLKRDILTACAQKALSQSSVVVITDPLSACTDCPLSKMYAGRGAMTVRLKHGGSILGFLSVSVPKVFCTDKEEQMLLKDMADDIALALRGIELEQERNQAQERSRLTAEKLQTIFNSVSDGLAIIGENLAVQEVNQSHLELSGLNRDQIIGKKCYKVFQHRDKPCDICALQPIFEEGETVRWEKTAVLKDGTVKYFDAQSIPIFDDDGNVTQVLNSTRDITGRKQAEEALRESEKKYKTLVDGSLTGIFIHQDGKYVFINDRFAQIHGYTSEELLGKEYLTLFLPHERAKFAEIVSKRLEGVFVPCHYEVQRLRKDGKIIWCEMMANCIEYGGRPAIMGNIIEVTERKRAEEEKKELEAQLRQAQKMEAVGTLAGGVAHDFNNILTTIIGNAELMLMAGDKDGPFRDEIGEIKIAGNRAASLTGQLLTFSRKQIVRPAILNLNELLTGLEKMLGRLLGEDVEILIVLESALWQIEIDPGQMEQVIMNLAINARDAMSIGGKLTIETANMDLDENYFHKRGIVEKQPGSYVMLAVSDTGIGMYKEVQERIFEPFYTTKDIGKGTGLGLSTIYGIIKQNNGFIWVYSEPGQGSIFKVYLPKVDGDANAKEVEQTPKENLDGSETVLIVEDDDSVRKFARKVLKRKGYRILEAKNGEDALKISKEHEGTIDLMITDVVMPKMNGKETAELLQPLYPQMKIIYMSGYTNNAIANRGILTKGIIFLEKPFSPEDLALKVREMLDKKQD